MLRRGRRRRQRALGVLGYQFARALESRLFARAHRRYRSGALSARPGRALWRSWSPTRTASEEVRRSTPSTDAMSPTWMGRRRAAEPRGASTPRRGSPRRPLRSAREQGAPRRSRGTRPAAFAKRFPARTSEAFILLGDPPRRSTRTQQRTDSVPTGIRGPRSSFRRRSTKVRARAPASQERTRERSTARGGPCRRRVSRLPTASTRTLPRVRVCGKSSSSLARLSRGRGPCEERARRDRSASARSVPRGVGTRIRADLGRRVPPRPWRTRRTMTIARARRTLGRMGRKTVRAWGGHTPRRHGFGPRLGHAGGLRYDLDGDAKKRRRRVKSSKFDAAAAYLRIRVVEFRPEGRG